MKSDKRRRSKIVSALLRADKGLYIALNSTTRILTHKTARKLQSPKPKPPQMRQQPSGSVRSRSSVLNAPHLRLAETVPRPAVGAAAAKQRRSPPLLAAAPNTAAAQTAGRQLLEAVQGTERGVTTSADTQKKIMALVEDLKHAGAGSKTGLFGLCLEAPRTLVPF